MGLEIPPLEIKIMLESNPLKPTMLVGRLGVRRKRPASGARTDGELMIIIVIVVVVVVVVSY